LATLLILDPGEEGSGCFSILLVVEGVEEKDVSINEDRFVSSEIGQILDHDHLWL